MVQREGVDAWCKGGTVRDSFAASAFGVALAGPPRIMHCRLTRLVLLLLGLLLISADQGRAATYDVLGHAFEVDALEPVGRGASRLILFGEQKIVPNEVVPLRIVQGYYHRGTLIDGFSPETVTPFIRRALAEAQTEIAYLTFRSLLVDKRVTPEELDTKLDELVGVKGIDAVFQRTIEEEGVTFSSPQIVSRTLFELAKQNPQWVRGHALRGVLLYKDDIRASIKDGLRDAIKDSDEAAFEQTLAVERELFVDGGPAHDSLLTVSQSAWRLSQTLRGAASFDEFVTAREAVKSDALMAEFLADAVRVAAQQGAQRALDAKQPERALEYLSRLGASSRSPLTYELLGKTLRDIQPTRDSPLYRQDVLDFLRTMVGGDSQLVVPARQALKSHLAFAVEQGLGVPTTGLQSFYIALGGSADQIPVAEPSQSQPEAAKPAPLPGTVERGRSLVARYGKIGAAILLFLILSGPAVIAFRFYEAGKTRMLRTRRGAGTLRQREDQRRLLRFGAQHSDSKGRFRPNQNSYAKDPVMREYVEALHDLKLGEGATLRDIKYAYRTTVKELHPDVQRGHDHASEGFIELTKLYERILSLRRQLGLDS